MDATPIFEELKRRIVATEVSQNAIAGIIQIQQASISRFLAGRTGLQAEAFLKLLYYVGGSVSFGGEAVSDMPCIKERDELRAENDRLKQRVIELESECRTQQKMLDKLLDGVSLSPSRKAAG